MSVDIRVKNEQKLSRRLNHISKKLETGSAGVTVALLKCGLTVEKAAVTEHLSGPRPDTLDRVTGTLAASINTQQTGKGRVSVGTNVEYARIHEFGGTIEKDRGQVAAGGIVHDIKTVIHMPARPYLRPALEDNRDQITAYMRDYLRIAIREATQGY